MVHSWGFRKSTHDREEISSCADVAAEGAVSLRSGVSFHHSEYGCSGEFRPHFSVAGMPLLK